MKKKASLILFIAFLILPVISNAQGNTAKPNLLFTIEGLSNPESAVIKGNTIFISNIGAVHPDSKDGDGWIAKFNMKDKKLKKWITGLNDPKGLRITKGKLYVADLDKIIVIDINKGKISKKISVRGARFINDIDVDSKGNIYTSDTRYGIIFVTNEKSKKTSILLKDMDEAPNGLIIKDDRLYVASWAFKMDPTNWNVEKQGSFFFIDLKDKSLHFIGPREIGSLDGLESYEKGQWLISDKNGGKVYLLDEASNKKNTLIKEVIGVADIGYDPSQKLLLLPITESNIVRVYSF